METVSQSLISILVMVSMAGCLARTPIVPVEQVPAEEARASHVERLVMTGSFLDVTESNLADSV